MTILWSVVLYWNFCCLQWKSCVAVSAATKKEAGGGTQCTAKGGGGIAHHAGQL